MHDDHEGECDRQGVVREYRRGFSAGWEGKRGEEVRPGEDEREPEREQERVDALQARNEHGDVLQTSCQSRLSTEDERKTRIDDDKEKTGVLP